VKKVNWAGSEGKWFGKKTNRFGKMRGQLRSEGRGCREKGELGRFGSKGTHFKSDVKGVFKPSGLLSSLPLQV
tara:strand:- start:677 stop:895 length:219 start_codon:yes stop_codon:yes gene_type:complete